MDDRRHPDRWLQHLFSLPFIYAPLFPILLFDCFMELYHHVCFPLYGLKKIDRKKYITFDRAKLSYLAWWEKINCAYCRYVNGLCGYATEIAAQTEKYWCGIKHKKRVGFHEPKHHKNFLAYGDESGYRNIK